MSAFRAAYQRYAITQVMEFAQWAERVPLPWEECAFAWVDPERRRAIEAVLKIGGKARDLWLLLGREPPASIRFDPDGTPCP